MRRECSTCSLCCKLVPVPPLGKKAGERCKHALFHKGCAIYHRPDKGFPRECGLWSCRWLINHDADDLSRPDRSHYVIDIVPDYITARQNDGSEPPTHLPVVQIWVDSGFPDAHRDPALRRWLERRSHEGYAALVRVQDNTAAILLIPPVMSSTGEFEEIGPYGAMNFQAAPHSGEDIAAKLNAAGIFPQ